MSRILPEPIAEQVLTFAEWRMGAQRIKVTLVDGRTFSPVDVAWSRRIVGVAGYEEVPFEAEDVVHLEDLSDGRASPSAGSVCTLLTRLRQSNASYRIH